MSNQAQAHYDVIVIGGGHAGRAGAVVNYLEWQFAPASARDRSRGRGLLARTGCSSLETDGAGIAEGP